MSSLLGQRTIEEVAGLFHFGNTSGNFSFLQFCQIIQRVFPDSLSDSHPDMSYVAVSLDQLWSSLAKMNAQQLSPDGDVEINYVHLLAGLIVFTPYCKSEKLQFLWNLFDEENSGGLSVRQFGEMLRVLICTLFSFSETFSLGSKCSDVFGCINEIVAEVLSMIYPLGESVDPLSYREFEKLYMAEYYLPFLFLELLESEKWIVPPKFFSLMEGPAHPETDEENTANNVHPNDAEADNYHHDLHGTDARTSEDEDDNALTPERSRMTPGESSSFVSMESLLEEHFPTHYFRDLSTPVQSSVLTSPDSNRLSRIRSFFKPPADQEEDSAYKEGTYPEVYASQSTRRRSVVRSPYSPQYRSGTPPRASNIDNADSSINVSQSADAVASVSNDPSMFLSDGNDIFTRIMHSDNSLESMDGYAEDEFELLPTPSDAILEFVLFPRGVAPLLNLSQKLLREGILDSEEGVLQDDRVQYFKALDYDPSIDGSSVDLSSDEVEDDASDTKRTTLHRHSRPSSRVFAASDASDEEDCIFPRLSRAISLSANDQALAKRIISSLSSHKLTPLGFIVSYLRSLVTRTAPDSTDYYTEFRLLDPSLQDFSFVNTLIQNTIDFSVFSDVCTNIVFLAEESWNSSSEERIANLKSKLVNPDHAMIDTLFPLDDLNLPSLYSYLHGLFEILSCFGNEPLKSFQQYLTMRENTKYELNILSRSHSAIPDGKIPFNVAVASTAGEDIDPLDGLFALLPFCWGSKSEKLSMIWKLYASIEEMAHSNTSINNSCLSETGNIGPDAPLRISREQLWRSFRSFISAFLVLGRGKFDSIPLDSSGQQEEECGERSLGPLKPSQYPRALQRHEALAVAAAADAAAVELCASIFMDTAPFRTDTNSISVHELSAWYNAGGWENSVWLEVLDPVKLCGIHSQLVRLMQDPDSPQAHEEVEVPGYGDEETLVEGSFSLQSPIHTFKDTYSKWRLHDVYDAFANIHESGRNGAEPSTETMDNTLENAVTRETTLNTSGSTSGNHVLTSHSRDFGLRSHTEGVGLRDSPYDFVESVNTTVAESVETDQRSEEMDSESSANASESGTMFDDTYGELPTSSEARWDRTTGRQVDAFEVQQGDCSNTFSVIPLLNEHSVTSIELEIEMQKVSDVLLGRNDRSRMNYLIGNESVPDVQYSEGGVVQADISVSANEENAILNMALLHSIPSEINVSSSISSLDRYAAALTEDDRRVMSLGLNDSNPYKSDYFAQEQPSDDLDHAIDRTINNTFPVYSDSFSVPNSLSNALACAKRFGFLSKEQIVTGFKCSSHALPPTVDPQSLDQMNSAAFIIPIFERDLSNDSVKLGVSPQDHVWCFSKVACQFVSFFSRVTRLESMNFSVISDITLSVAKSCDLNGLLDQPNFNKVVRSLIPARLVSNVLRFQLTHFFNRLFHNLQLVHGNFNVVPWRDVATAFSLFAGREGKGDKIAFAFSLYAQHESKEHELNISQRDDGFTSRLRPNALFAYFRALLITLATLQEWGVILDIVALVTEQQDLFEAPSPAISPVHQSLPSLIERIDSMAETYVVELFNHDKLRYMDKHGSDFSMNDTIAPIITFDEFADIYNAKDNSGSAIFLELLSLRKWKLFSGMSEASIDNSLNSISFNTADDWKQLEDEQYSQVLRDKLMQFYLNLLHEIVSKTPSEDNESLHNSFESRITTNESQQSMISYEEAPQRERVASSSVHADYSNDEGSLSGPSSLFSPREDNQLGSEPNLSFAELDPQLAAFFYPSADYDSDDQSALDKEFESSSMIPNANWRSFSEAHADMHNTSIQSMTSIAIANIQTPIFSFEIPILNDVSALFSKDRSDVNNETRSQASSDFQPFFDDLFQLDLFPSSCATMSVFQAATNLFRSSVQDIYLELRRTAYFDMLRAGALEPTAPPQAVDTISWRAFRQWIRNPESLMNKYVSDTITPLQKLFANLACTTFFASLVHFSVLDIGTFASSDIKHHFGHFKHASHPLKRKLMELGDDETVSLRALTLILSVFANGDKSHKLSLAWGLSHSEFQSPSHTPRLDRVVKHAMDWQDDTEASDDGEAAMRASPDFALAHSQSEGVDTTVDSMGSKTIRYVIPEVENVEEVDVFDAESAGNSGLKTPVSNTEDLSSDAGDAESLALTVTELSYLFRTLLLPLVLLKKWPKLLEFAICYEPHLQNASIATAGKKGILSPNDVFLSLPGIALNPLSGKTFQDLSKSADFCATSILAAANSPNAQLSGSSPFIPRDDRELLTVTFADFGALYSTLVYLPSNYQDWDESTLSVAQELPISVLLSCGLQASSLLWLELLSPLKWPSKEALITLENSAPDAPVPEADNSTLNSSVNLSYILNLTPEKPQSMLRAGPAPDTAAVPAARMHFPPPPKQPLSEAQSTGDHPRPITRRGRVPGTSPPDRNGFDPQNASARAAVLDTDSTLEHEVTRDTIATQMVEYELYKDHVVQLFQGDCSSEGEQEQEQEQDTEEEYQQFLLDYANRSAGSTCRAITFESDLESFHTEHSKSASNVSNLAKDWTVLEQTRQEDTLASAAAPNELGVFLHPESCPEYNEESVLFSQPLDETPYYLTYSKDDAKSMVSLFAFFPFSSFSIDDFIAFHKNLANSSPYIFRGDLEAAIRTLASSVQWSEDYFRRLLSHFESLGAKYSLFDLRKEASNVLTSSQTYFLHTFDVLSKSPFAMKREQSTTITGSTPLAAKHYKVQEHGIPWQCLCLAYLPFCNGSSMAKVEAAWTLWCEYCNSPLQNSSKSDDTESSKFMNLHDLDQFFTFVMVGLLASSGLSRKTSAAAVYSVAASTGKATVVLLLELLEKFNAVFSPKKPDEYDLEIAYPVFADLWRLCSYDDEELLNYRLTDPRLSRTDDAKEKRFLGSALPLLEEYNGLFLPWLDYLDIKYWTVMAFVDEDVGEVEEASEVAPDVDDDVTGGGVEAFHAPQTPGQSSPESAVDTQPAVRVLSGPETVMVIADADTDELVFEEQRDVSSVVQTVTETHVKQEHEFNNLPFEQEEQMNEVSETPLDEGAYIPGLVDAPSDEEVEEKKQVVDGEEDVLAHSEPEISKKMLKEQQSLDEVENVVNVVSVQTEASAESFPASESELLETESEIIDDPERPETFVAGDVEEGDESLVFFLHILSEKYPLSLIQRDIDHLQRTKQFLNAALSYEADVVMDTFFRNARRVANISFSPQRQVNENQKQFGLTLSEFHSAVRSTLNELAGYDLPKMWKASDIDMNNSTNSSTSASEQISAKTFSLFMENLTAFYFLLEEQSEKRATQTASLVDVASLAMILLLFCDGGKTEKLLAFWSAYEEEGLLTAKEKRLKSRSNATFSSHIYKQSLIRKSALSRFFSAYLSALLSFLPSDRDSPFDEETLDNVVVITDELASLVQKHSDQNHSKDSILNDSTCSSIQVDSSVLEDTISFAKFGSWYNAGGFEIAAFIELLDWSKLVANSY